MNRYKLFNGGSNYATYPYPYNLSIFNISPTMDTAADMDKQESRCCSCQKKQKQFLIFVVLSVRWVFSMFFGFLCFFFLISLGLVSFFLASWHWLWFIPSFCVCVFVPKISIEYWIDANNKSSVLNAKSNRNKKIHQKLSFAICIHSVLGGCLFVFSLCFYTFFLFRFYHHF